MNDAQRRFLAKVVEGRSRYEGGTWPVKNEWRSARVLERAGHIKRGPNGGWVATESGTAAAAK